MLNGNTIELGVCYYPEHWDTSFWKEDMLRMKSYGIGVIRVAEFAWNLCLGTVVHFAQAVFRIDRPVSLCR